jgi:HEAT repeat protein
MSTPRRIRHAVLVLLLLTATSAFGGNDISRLAQQLNEGDDFRMRVQAALNLGKSGDGQALVPLYRGMNDKSAAVRVASAAALKTLGDPAALPELLRHQNDSSPEVRRQVKGAIAALRAQQRHDQERRRDARLLVKLGKVRNGSKVTSEEAELTVKQASRDQLDQLPGVALLSASEDADKASKSHKLPVVLMTGSIRELNAAKDGGELVYSAQVEYVVHRMPEQAIVAKVSGRASARASAVEVRDRRRREELREEVLDAAVASAMKSAPRALLAAVD